MLFEVGEERSIGEVLEARGVIGHYVGLPWEEVRLMAAPMLALVTAGVVAEVSGGPFGGSGPFGQAGEARRVVCAGGDGPVSDVMACGHDGELAVDASLLEVAVGDGSRGVVHRDESLLDAERERETP